MERGRGEQGRDERRPMAMTRPRIAVTLGDPAGIGPEIAAIASADPRVLASCEPVLYGPPQSERFEVGRLSARAGQAAYDAVVRAVAAKMEHTAPEGFKDARVVWGDKFCVQFGRQVNGFIVCYPNPAAWRNPYPLLTITFVPGFTRYLFLGLHPSDESFSHQLH